MNKTFEINNNKKFNNDFKNEKNNEKDSLHLQIINNKIVECAIRKNIEHLIVLQAKPLEAQDIQLMLNRFSIFVKIIENAGKSNIKAWKAAIKILEYFNAYEDILSIMRQMLLYFEEALPEDFLKIIDEKLFLKNTNTDDKNIYNMCGLEIFNLQNPSYIYSDLIIKLYKDFGEIYNVYMKRIVMPTYATLHISYKSVENRIIAVCIPTFNDAQEYEDHEENGNGNENNGNGTNKKMEALNKYHRSVESSCKNKFFLTKEKVEVFSCMYSDCLKMVNYMKAFENTHTVFYIISNKNKKYSDISQLKKENGMLFILGKEKIILLNKMLFRWCFSMIDKENEEKVIDYTYMCHASKLKDFKFK